MIQYEAKHGMMLGTLIQKLPSFRKFGIYCQFLNWSFRKLVFLPGDDPTEKWPSFNVNLHLSCSNQTAGGGSYD